MAIEKAAWTAAGRFEPTFVAAARRAELAVEQPGFWRGIGESLGMVKPKRGISPVGEQVKAQLSQAHELLSAFIDKNQWIKNWKYGGDVEKGEKGLEKTFWLRHTQGNMAVGKKSANLMMTAHERMTYVMGHWLDMPVNKVQFGHFKFDASKPESELISIHHSVGAQAQKAYRISNELGFKDSNEMDFRTKRGNLVAEFVTGPSSWNLADKGARFARLSRRLVNPEIFDRIQLFDRFLENTDRHGGNYMVTPAGKNRQKEVMYRVDLIDHGRTLTWKDPLHLADRLAYFASYLDTLSAETNLLHLGNILPDLCKIAALTDEQLDKELFAGVSEQMLPADTRANESALLKGKRDLIRSWLDGHIDYLARHFPKQ